MDWGKIKFFLGEVFRNFTRNAGMQATAIGTVAVTIVLLGRFSVRADEHRALGQRRHEPNHDLGLHAAATQRARKMDGVRTALAKDDRILSTAFVPKNEGLHELRDRMKGQIDTSILTENPLPDKFRVRVRQPEEVPAVAAAIRKLQNVQSVDYGQDVVQRLLQLAGVARRVGIALIALFIVVAGIIISNTIRLTVFARRREISIMQLVGATNMYIRLPFICEGLIDGVLGALLAVGVLAVARGMLVPKLALALPWLQLERRTCGRGAARSAAVRCGSSSGRRRFVDSSRTLSADVNRDLLDELLALKAVLAAVMQIAADGVVQLDERRHIVRFYCGGRNAARPLRRKCNRLRRRVASARKQCIRDLHERRWSADARPRAA